MKIPLMPSRLKVRRQSVRWLIIHHTAELYTLPETFIDNSKYQFFSLFNQVMERKEPDINYHYVIDKIRDEYVPIITRPFTYLCEWNDIDVEINNRAIHIALLGSYDVKVPEKRMYEILAHRILNPFLKLYGLSPARVKLHYEISNNKELSCPGDFIDKNIIIAMTRRFVIK